MRLLISFLIYSYSLISNRDIMNMSNISTSIITKFRTGQNIVEERGEHPRCVILHAHDIMIFVAREK